jgi:hypothetical protein
MTHQKPFRGIQLNRTHPLVKGLVGCWVFNEATGKTVFDLSGHNNHGVLKNGVAWGSNGLGYDGIDGHADMGDKQIVTNAITISTLIKPNDIANNQAYVVAKYDTSTNGREYAVYLDGVTNVCKLLIGNADGSGFGAATFNNLTTHFQNRVWSNLIFTRSENTIHCSINGSKVALFDNNVGVNDFANTNSTLQIGDRTNGGKAFDGSIGPTIIWDQVKSAEEGTWLYREPYAMFRQSIV